MQIVVLLVTSIILSFVTLGYLICDIDGKRPKIRELFLCCRQYPKHVVYVGVMMICLIGLSTFLPMTYRTNTLAGNLKLTILIATLFVIANIDYRRHIIPNKVLAITMLLRLPVYVLELLTEPNTFLSILKGELVACVIVVLFFVIGIFVVKNGLGMGDIKLMAVMCFYQGFYGVISSLFFSLFVAFVMAIVLLIMKKKTRKDAIAFAPAILVGTILSVFMTGM